MQTIRLTRAQVREIDRRSIEEFHIPGIVLMENAARGASNVATEMLAGVRNPSAVIVCGGGNNGGDGLAIARHLRNAGVAVRIVKCWTGELRGDAKINLDICVAMKLAIVEQTPFADVDLIVDAMFGTGLSRPIDGPLAQRVADINNARRPILAIDIPSGLDCDTGRPLGPCVVATRTVTFVAEKTGFASPESHRYLGRVTVTDIGCPRELIAACKDRT